MTTPCPVESMVLNAAYDAGGAIAYEALSAAVPATRRKLFHALVRQSDLGNIRRHWDGEPITLTASARAAIAAGRMAA